MLSRIIKKILPSSASIPTLRSLIARESVIGGQLFGAIPAGHRREFFCLDDKTWIWHEEWVDLDGKRQSVTTRYEIQQHGIVKAQDGQRYSYVTGREAKNLLQAMKLYYERTSAEVYGRQPSDILV